MNRKIEFIYNDAASIDIRILLEAIYDILNPSGK